jgi:hypothetical protein
MSHLTSVATRLISGAHIVQALQAMGYDTVRFFEEPQLMLGYSDSSARKKAEIILRRRDANPGGRGLMADVGFARNEEGVFDWIITREDRRKLGESWYDELNQRYAYYIVLDSLEQQGFSQVEVEREADQSIRLVMRRMT